MSITRRLFLRNGAVAGAAIGTVTASAAATPATALERAQAHWTTFCAAVEELSASQPGHRLQMFASHHHGIAEPCVRIEVMGTEIEQIHSFKMRVERLVSSQRLGAKGWERGDE